MTEPDTRETFFLTELSREEKMEWRWMRLNRAANNLVNWVTWLTRLWLLIVSLTLTRLESLESLSALWLGFDPNGMVAILAAVNIISPLIGMQARFHQRLKVHDGNARGYDAIRVELLTGMISLDVAVKRYIEIRRRSPEVEVFSDA